MQLYVATLDFLTCWQCLNEWRRTSANDRSYYQCDQCLFKYNMRRTALADIVQSYYVVEVTQV